MAAPVGLADAKIKSLKAPATGQAEYSDSLVPALRLRVGSSGTKTFILRKRVGGRARNLTLDRYHERRFTLADVRKKARALISDIEAGAVLGCGSFGAANPLISNQAPTFARRCRQPTEAFAVTSKQILLIATVGKMPRARPVD